MNLSTHLARISQRAHLILIALAISLIWLFDYYSGPELSVSIFYLLPVIFSSWYLGRRVGLLTGSVCAIAWLFNDLTTNPASYQSFVPYWNAGVRLATFLLVAHALSSLKRAHEWKEDLITFVIHDLRTPLANIMTSLELIEQLKSENGSDETRKFLGLGLSSGHAMLTLIDSLLDLSRLERQQMPVELQPVLVSPLLQEAVEQVGAQAIIKGVHIELHTADENQTVWADPSLLGRVLVNLLGNALKFSPEDSTIRVQGRVTNGERLQIIISDEGPGIPSTWHQRAFEKYRQLQAPEEGVFAGSGLGLAFCRLAIEAQRGHIWLETGQPSGAIVFLSLPLRANDQVAAASPAPRSAKPRA